MNLLTILVAILMAGTCHSLFVPEQLTTLLSFLYTNIPPIKKGTDSRVGVGFRLGPNADFQVLFELGPQQETQPLSGQEGDGSNNAKREVPGVKAKPHSWLHSWKLQQDGSLGGHQGHYQNVPVLDQDVINHLKQLYKQQPKTNGQEEDEAGAEMTEQVETTTGLET